MTKELKIQSRQLMCSRVAIISITWALLLCGSYAKAEQVELRFTSALPAGGVNEQTEWWAEEVAKRTDGEVTVRRFYDASLMGGVEVLDAVQDGRVETGNFAPSYWPAEFPLLNIASIPFYTDDSGAYLQALRALLDNSAVQEELKRNNVEVLMWFPHAPAASGTAARVTSLDELDGMRLRTTGDVATAMQMIGVEAVAQDPAQTYESIQRGVLDGFGAMLFDVVPLIGYHEVAPYVFDAGVGLYASGGIMIRRDFIESLSDEHAEVLRAVAQESMDTRAIQTLMKLEDEACSEILDEGGEVYTLPDSEIREWKEIVGNTIIENWREAAMESGVSEEDVDSVQETWEQSLSANTPSDYEHGMRRCAERSG